MLNITFDHSRDNVMQAVLSDNTALDKAKSLVLFHTICQPYVIQDQYGFDIVKEETHENDLFELTVPAQARTQSGVLEACLKYCTTDQEQLALLLVFTDQRKTALDIHKAYESFSRIDEIAAEIAKKLGGQLSGSQQLKLELLKSKLQHISELDELFEFIKASNGSYDIFKSLVPDGEPIKYLLSKLHNILNSFGDDDDE